MKRPDLMPFDVDRYRSDEKVAVLRPTARCFWFEVFLVMWKSGRTGVLSGSYADLAKLTRTSRTEAESSVAEIKDRDVADVTIVNGNKKGDEIVTLVCRSMKRDHDKRVSTRERVDLHRKRKRGDASVTRSVTPSVTTGETSAPSPSPAPSPFSPPDPLSLPHPHSPPPTLPISGEIGAADAAESIDSAIESGAEAYRAATADVSSNVRPARLAKPRADRKNKLTLEQNAVRLELQRWWIHEAWPTRHGGVKYEFHPGSGLDGDGPAVLRILKSDFAKWDLERAKLICEAFLDNGRLFHSEQGHPISLLARHLSKWVVQANFILLRRQQPKKTNGEHHATDTSLVSRGSGPDAFRGARRALPVG